MSKITNDGLTQSDIGCFIGLYPYDNSGRHSKGSVVDMTDTSDTVQAYSLRYHVSVLTVWWWWWWQWVIDIVDWQVCAEAETGDNDEELRRQFGRPVSYGDVIQVDHMNIHYSLAALTAPSDDTISWMMSDVEENIILHWKSIGTHVFLRDNWASCILYYMLEITELFNRGCDAP